MAAFAVFAGDFVFLISKSDEMRYADVIVPLAVEGMYTYAIPDELESVVGRGMLVLVSFAGNKKYTALVVEVHGQKPEGYDVKEVEGVAEEQIRFSALHLKFLLWMSSYYMATPGEVMKAALPVMFRLESFTSVTRTEEEIDYIGLTNGERALLIFLQPGEYVSLKEAEKYLKIRNGMPLVKSLLAKGYIRVKEVVDELFHGKSVHVVTQTRVYSGEEWGELLDGLKRAPVQYRTLCRWIESGRQECERSEFFRQTGSNATVLKSLCERGILKVERRSCRVLPEELEWQGDSSRLTPEQERAYEGIKAGFEGKDCILLQGVTSSGKTEVYIHLIKSFLEGGRQVLYMLPEIALTVQIVRRLQRVFGNNIGIYHSGMSDQARAELWRKQCSEHPYPLILGVRSAVFLPFASLGLIIVDEEHDASYKQKEPSPRYNGRDAAIMLGKMAGARILLGSATPSFESYQNAVSGKYGLVELQQRYGGVQMPELMLADLGEFRRKKLMQGSFSPLLIREMRAVLSEGKQVILFQNRRGYSSYVQCECCGAIPKCRYCDVSLTYYKERNLLVCRYCGAIVPVSDCCSGCGGHYKERIPGTERVEEEVGRLFPGSRVARMDVDVMSSKARFRRVIEDFEQGKTDILIGTQMVTKGLDFENVKLVGVMDADSMINFPDFRAEERAYCMLMQVSGRCGRRGERGKVVIQAADLKNRVYTMLTEGDYPAFFAGLLAERQLFVYPPAGRMIQVEMRHKDVVVLRNAANVLAGRLREKLGKRICGPAVPEISRIGGQNRLILLVKIEPVASCSRIKTLLKSEFVHLRGDKVFGSVRIFCDVDP